MIFRDPKRAPGEGSASARRPDNHHSASRVGDPAVDLLLFQTTTEKVTSKQLVNKGNRRKAQEHLAGSSSVLGARASITKALKPHKRKEAGLEPVPS